MQDSPSNTSYDEVPYESAPFRQTHPDRLATLGRLFGMQPASVEACRVLELGCAGGGNLIPMAFHLPGSRFVGVDLSSRQVASGQKVIRDLALENIDLRCCSILDGDASWGTFDYIICHGVYSWVPDEVQEKIFAVCQQLLAPRGIAYISYNTYPGWHMREIIRRMMLFHAGQFDDTAKRIEQARAVVDFLAGAVPTEDNYYGLMLRSELEMIRRSRDSYLFHEHLEQVNAPIYFYEFIQKAAAHGLQYLAEADFGTMLAGGFPAQVSETLDKISPDIIHMEQYMDFVRNRQFRQTLLCRQDVALKREIGPAGLAGLLMASPAYPRSADLDFKKGAPVVFQAPNGATIETDAPLTKAVMARLHACWPRALSSETLVAEALQILRDADCSVDQPMETAKAAMFSDLLRSYVVNAVELRTWQADFMTEISPKPQISALALYQANSGQGVVNQRHELVNLDFFSGSLLKLLDGTRNHKQLLDELIRMEAAGGLTLKKENLPLTEPDQIRAVIIDALQKTLAMLQRAAFLVG